MIERTATVMRDTLESQITIEVNLDGAGRAELDTPVPFLNHMLNQIARHGYVDLNIRATGIPRSMTIIRLKILALLWVWQLLRLSVTKRV